ncbi:alpha/beta hydrolase [Streptomyces subrutilus]|uniref:Alpha/beta hydrolase n=1 Tax=Streptomyces subrutilus TaxID=36818 RepID=A0A5P2UHW5_9ACTN|nr:alpha/beta hydrolase [Streptomyces subrutilus]QEU77044.1 alpha/beta hydrolase [Streptomyces subrutilus]GGZ96423.1 alpha/beta hydrolase [Streptomyces subrutilus]
MHRRNPFLACRAAAAVLACVSGVSGCHAPAAGPGAPAASSSVPSSGDFSGPVDIGGGRRIHLSCKGSGRPTVILESGLHDSSDTWTFTDTRPPVPKSPAVFPGVAAFARVCTYDRPGTVRYSDPPALTTRSTPVGGTRSLTAMADDLDRLLTAAHLPAPYLLVGHSYGGMITRLYAQRNPHKTAGLVFVDAFGTDMRPLFGAQWPAYLKLLDSPGTPLAAQRGFETVDVDGAVAAIEAAGPLPAVPLVVLSKTEPFAAPPGAPKALLDTLERAWPVVQRSLVRLGPQTPQYLATGSDHYVQVHDPDLTIGAVRLAVGRIGTRP